MKLRHTLIMSAAFLMAYQANAGTPSTIDPAAKEIASMMCRWVLDGGKLTDPAQRLTIYENGKYERWLELHSSDKGGMPPIVYERHREGGFVADDKYKEYYWKGSNFRLTMLQDAILRKSEVTLALEDIYNASMPISDAKCENVTYANSN
ncbi:hypothetical protein EEQ70_22480 [Escherichia coli]|uniref:hypothetical protein n=1 Tax=Escherichia coli TaxID=562 RepID=UPI000DA50491|nr:hypothetical protein [Escherichia coli]EEW0711181.1 hypothetical protein [Escherichia coli]EFB4733523.1 hypothetical protein [Escherichia coli]EFB4734009.1 hypothetical protein [Escherichia coli]EFN5486018.1 hypothetical protein [Escherichia coli]EIX0871199.1 hypothetical protein [Escherichia coli]